MKKVGLCLLLLACDSRPEIFDRDITNVSAFGLAKHVCVLDDSGHRVIALHSDVGTEATREAIPIGHSVVHAAVARDKSRLFVLSAGDILRTKDKQEKASLTILEEKGSALTSRRLELTTPHTSVTVDPEGRYLAISAASADSVANSRVPFVENPNEIVLVDLTEQDPAKAMVVRTIRSFGGSPKRVTFSPKLSLPGGERRLLIVESDVDLTLIDLNKLREGRPEITVRLTSGASARAASPEQVVIDDGDPAKNDDARIAVRLAGDSNVITLKLGPSAAGAPNDFAPTPNLSDVGGAPSDIAFVRTDAGLRLAALVPTARIATLVDPDTSITQPVALPDGYSHLTLVSSTGAADNALLYGNGSSVAFWALGRTGNEAYRSVEVLPLETVVSELSDVPAPRNQLKILRGETGFFVLDLLQRTASPLRALNDYQIRISSSGERIWAFERGGSRIASVNLANLHPVESSSDRQITDVFEIERPDKTRALVAVDTRAPGSAVVFDAKTPDTANSRTYYGILLEGLR